MESPLLSKREHHVNIIADDCSSTIAQMPCIFAIAFNSMELFITLVQIIAAIVVVTGAKGDHPETAWIIVYTCGCIANLPILCCSFWPYQNASSEIINITALVIDLKTIIEYFFAGWCTGFLWVFVTNSSSLDHTAPLFWLSVTFIAFSFIRYVLPSLICAAMCCCMYLTTDVMY